MKHISKSVLFLLIPTITSCAPETRSCPPAESCAPQSATFCTVVTDCLIVRKNTVLEGNVTGAGLNCISGGGGQAITGPTGATGATGPVECVCCFTDQLSFGPFDMQSQGNNPLTTAPTPFSPYTPTSNASLYGWELPVPGSDPNNTITMQFEVPSDYDFTLGGFTLDMNILIPQNGVPDGNILLNIFSDFLSSGQEAGAGTGTQTSQEIGVAEPIGGPNSVRQQRLTVQLTNLNAAINDVGQISISRIPASTNEYDASIYLATASLIYRKRVCGIELN